MIRPSIRPSIALAVALAVACIPALAPLAGTAPVARAADSGLTLVGNTTYDVRPDEGRVAVTVALTATNTLKDTKTKKFYFRVAYVTVVPGTEGFKLTAASGKPKVSVSSSTDTYTNLKLDFGANLPAGKSTTLTLTYDIKDKGGAPDRAIRVSQSLVSFAAWAVAGVSSPGGSVTVRFPAGYEVLVRRGPLQGPTRDASGHDVWTSGTLAAPLDFVADFLADRPTDYSEKQFTVALQNGTATIALQAWPDDTQWADRVRSLVERALPVLEEEIGLPWLASEPLQIREALIRSTGGYAGIYDPNEHRIDIAYAAPDAVVIHELAHAWFNGGLVADRWIAEGFASHYAEVAAKQLGVDPIPVTPPDPAAPVLPLNAWGAATPDANEAESWGYAASLQVANAIASRAGDDAMRAVWARAASGVGAYMPVNGGGTEPAIGGPDWRGLLDLLEEASGRDFTDLWRQWVARPQDLAALSERAQARGYYARSVEAAGDWQLPASIRLAMRAWRFDIAREQLTAADAVLRQRVALEATAASAGATLPPTLRTAFEGAAGLEAAAAEATAEQSVVDAIAAASAAKPTETGALERLLVQVGLLFQDPDARLAEALAGLTAGNLQPAYEAATSAESSWRNAADAGRSRIISVVLLLIAAVLLIGLLRRSGTLARHPARPADDEGGATTQA